MLTIHEKHSKNSVNQKRYGVFPFNEVSVFRASEFQLRGKFT